MRKCYLMWKYWISDLKGFFSEFDTLNACLNIFIWTRGLPACVQYRPFVHVSRGMSQCRKPSRIIGSRNDLDIHFISGRMSTAVFRSVLGTVKRATGIAKRTQQCQKRIYIRPEKNFSIFSQNLQCRFAHHPRFSHPEIHTPEAAKNFALQLDERGRDLLLKELRSVHSIFEETGVLSTPFYEREIFFCAEII